MTGGSTRSAPEIRLDNVRETAGVALENLEAGARGELVPVLTRSRNLEDAGFRVDGDGRGFRVEA